MTKEVQGTGPAPIGPYSAGLRVGKRLYISGQIALDPQSGELNQGGIGAQCRQVMEQIGSILQADGMSYSDLVQCRIYLTDLNDFQEVNQIYGSFLKKPYPTRATVEISRLPKGAGVEIEALAEIP